MHFYPVFSPRLHTHTISCPNLIFTIILEGWLATHCFIIKWGFEPGERGGLSRPNATLKKHYTTLAQNRTYTPSWDMEGCQNESKEKGSYVEQTA